MTLQGAQKSTGERGGPNKGTKERPRRGELKRGPKRARNHGGKHEKEVTTSEDYERNTKEGANRGSSDIEATQSAGGQRHASEWQRAMEGVKGRRIRERKSNCEVRQWLGSKQSGNGWGASSHRRERSSNVEEN
ncbi:unnamed protein product [Calypogeia fissa]